MTVIDEKMVRVKLSAMGFQKISKRYGQRHEPIVSADKNGARIWVHLNTGHFSMKSGGRYTGGEDFDTFRGVGQ